MLLGRPATSMGSCSQGPRPRMNRTFICLCEAHFSIRKLTRMMKRGDARGAHTGSCKSGDVKRTSKRRIGRYQRQI